MIFEEAYGKIGKQKGWMGESDCRALFEEALNIQDGLILEIGCFMGRSTKMLALASPTSHIVSIDPLATVHDSIDEKADNVYKRLHEEMDEYDWEHIQKYSQDVKWNKPIDLLHIDGDHREKQLREDIKKFIPFVKKGGVVMFHDYAVGIGEPEENGSRVHPVFEDIKDTYFTSHRYVSGFGVGVV